MSRFVRTSAVVCLCAVVAHLSSAYGQVSKVPTPSPAGPPIKILPVESKDTLDFGVVGVNQLRFATFTEVLKKDKILTAHLDGSSEFKEEFSPHCKKRATHDNTKCLVVVGFRPTQAQEIDATLIMDGGDKPEIDLTGTGTSTPAESSTEQCTAPDRAFLPTVLPRVIPPGSVLPRGSEGLAEQVAKDFGVDPYDDIWNKEKEAVINCYYSTEGQLAFFTQFKSIYNGASQSATISANIGSYNFNNGMQLSLGTNIQAGSGGNSVTTLPASGHPVLAAASAAQAGQNLFFGGNIYVYDLLPIITKTEADSDRWHFSADVLAREGVDLQNFNGTSTSTTNPTSHFNFLGEAYWQYDSNPPSNSKTVPLAIFIGGQYGYAYTSHDYAREYGFSKVNSQIADASIGILVTGQFNVAASKEFGPSQIYVDGSTNALTTANNFKAWSFGIQYQSKGVSAR